MKRIWIPEAPYIHRRRLIEGELIAPKARIQGIMTVELVRADNGLVARRLRFPNLIVDAGMNALATTDIGISGGLTNYCAVGTGNSAPANAQTQLDTEVARTNNAGGFVEERGVDGGLAYTWWKRTRVFTTAQANANLSEIGFFQSSSGGTMFARQLIKDELGDPTVITKTDEYELRVIYEIRWYVPAEVEYSALIDGVSRTIRTRAARVLSGTAASNRGWRPDGSGDFVGAISSGGGTTIYTGSLGAVTSNPSGTNVVSNSNTVDAYVADSFERTQLSKYSASIANGVNYISFTPGFRLPSVTKSGDMVFQHEILGGASILKDNTQRFDVYAQISWARYTP